MIRNFASALVVIAVLGSLVGCYDVSGSGSPPPAVEVGEVATLGGEKETTTGGAATEQVNLQIVDWNGLQRLIASHRGKVVVLDCWSTSCAPCIKEFPNLVALQKRHGHDDLACISLSFDYEGIGEPEAQRDRVLAFLKQKRATFDNVLSSLDADALTGRLEIPSIPAVFVYDRQGNLQARFDNRHASQRGGPFTYEQVSAVVEQLLAQSTEQRE